MKLASSLALKWLGGIAAVGGAGGGVFVLHKSGHLSGGGKKSKDKGDSKNQSDLKTTTDKSLAQQPPQPLPSNPQGVASPTLPVDNHQNDVDISITTSDEGLGVPLRCENENDGCTLENVDEIKKIKFQALGDSKEPVTVTGLANGDTISLTVEGSGDNKRYVFKNDSDELTISKGSSHTLKLPTGKTRFVVDNKSLKKLEEGNYGLPKDCETNNSCTLTSSDLETIKFSDFTEGTMVDSVEGLSREQTISLTIEEGKYIFTSPSSVTITKSGSAKVQLEDGETEFKVDNDKLKKVVLGDFGLPEECKFDDASNPKTCSLSSRDLKKIKFKDMGTNISISRLKNTEKVSLEIKKANDSSFPDDRKYVFTPKGSSDVAISGTQTITLSKGVENTFKKDRGGDALVALPKRTDPSDDVKALDTKISGLGLPNSCTFTEKASGNDKSIECELTTEELKNLKFSEGDVQSTSGGQGEGGEQVGDPTTYKIKIEEPKNNEGDYGTQKIRVIFLNKGENDWSSDLIIGFNGDSSPITIANKTDTEFKINNQNKLEIAWKEDSLTDLVGLKCPKEKDSSQLDCTLKKEGGPIKLFIDNQPKEFKPSKEDIETNLTFEIGQSDYNQGFKFNLKEKISGSVGSDPATTFELDKDSYEIRRINDHGWRLAKKESIFGR